MQTVTAHGAAIPALGFGLFRVADEEVERVVPAALEAGFRHFDTAQIYKNEATLGRALQAAGARRDELFLTTKVWVSKYSPEKFAASVDESLDKLQVHQVDLLLLHWPSDRVPIAEQIAMLNEVHEAGKTKFVGVSNQTIAQLRQSVELSAAPIVTNQVELHPYLPQHRLAKAAAGHGVALTAYYAMADGAVPQDETLQRIGAKYGKSAAQICLRWLVQQGHVVLSKTARPERVKENIAIFDFTLDQADMAEIAGLARQDGRIVNPEGLAPEWDA